MRVIILNMIGGALWLAACFLAAIVAGYVMNGGGA